jgi:hypothetical protein
VLFGAAAALKYSNAMFALAAVVLVVSQPAARISFRLRALAAYCAGGAAGLALFGGPTFVHLYREYGNPVFPLFNAWFRSPDFPSLSVSAERFAPKTVADALTFPLRIVSPEAMIYAEISAPDLRLPRSAHWRCRGGCRTRAPRRRARPRLRWRAWICGCSFFSLFAMRRGSQARQTVATGCS